MTRISALWRLDALIDSGHLAVVVALEDQIRGLSRKPGFDDPEGGADDR